MGTVTVNGKPVPTGCMIDGHHGHHVQPMMITLAMEHGFAPSPEDADLAINYGAEWHTYTPEQYEAIVDIADRAIAYLNSITEGGEWIEDDGELFLWTNVVCPECGDTMVPGCGIDWCDECERVCENCERR
jgi:hypothetical protein